MWNDLKFQIHWNKIEQANPRSCDERKNTFCVSSKTDCFKDDVKPSYWVGNSQLRSLNTYDLFKITPGVDAKQASVTGKAEEQSVSRGKKNPVLLQQEEESSSGETNDNADVNAEANEINDKKKDMVFKIEEENKTLEYQEKMNVDIKKIDSTKQPFGDQYMKLLMIHILKY